MATLAFLAAVTACSVTHSEPTPSLSPMNVTLTARAATASTPLPRMTAQGGVRIAVISIKNPSAQGLLIKVSLTSPSGRLAELGTFSPYPVDQPGSSAHLRLTTEGAEIAAGPASLVLQMTAMPDGAPLNPDLSITLAVAPTPAGGP